MGRRKPILYIHHGRPFKAEHAFMTAELLESVVRMLWREYGDDMADFQARAFPDDPPSPYVCVYCDSRRTSEADQS